MIATLGHKAGKQDWETPDWVFDHWDDLFSFNLDVCADESNRKCPAYFNEYEDGLDQKWWYYSDRTTHAWMNCPYGRGIVEKWVKKAYEESQNGVLVCALLPVSTSTKWWQEYVTKADHIFFYPKRIKFVGAKGSPNFDNAIVIWGLNP